MTVGYTKSRTLFWTLRRQHTFSYLHPKQTAHPVPVQYCFCHQKLHIRTHLAMLKADKKPINHIDTVSDV